MFDALALAIERGIQDMDGRESIFRLGSGRDTAV
jgi:hypothetical protein